MTQDTRTSLGGSLPTIFWLSVLGLYLELLLIRWIGTEVRVFAYLQNTVLVVCFLGLGAGLFSSRRDVDVTRLLRALVALTLAIVVPASRVAFANISNALGMVASANIWGGVELQDRAMIPVVVGGALVLTVALLAALIEVFVPLGRLLGRQMDEAGKPLVAYSVNVLGSLVGTLLFVGVSVASLPPWVWFLLLGALMLPLVRGRRAVDVVLLGVIAFAPVIGAQFDDAERTV